MDDQPTGKMPVPDQETQEVPNLHIMDTLRHKSLVSYNITKVIAELSKRSALHDNSKLTVNTEFHGYSRTVAKLALMRYGTQEYREATKTPAMKEAVASHYHNNDHHPEHFFEGVSGMNLIQIIEMVADWLAASKRNPEDNIWKNLSSLQERFGIDKQLAEIISNTILWLESNA